MKTKSPRRTFLKQSTVLGGGLLLLGSKAQPSPAADTETKSAGGAASPANETIKTLRSLRTIHGNFLDKPLPESALKTILQASVRAANASNMQSYSIVVVKDRAMMKQVCTYQGSCMLLYCVDEEEQVRQYDDPERHLALDENWKARGHKHYMDWWFKDWLGGAKPTEKETQMLQLLKKCGFVELQKA